MSETAVEHPTGLAALAAGDPDRLMPLKQLARYLPHRGGRAIGYGTLYRWAGDGARGHRLETVSLGGRLYVTPAAALSFFAACGARPASRGARRGGSGSTRAREYLRRQGLID
ncbi:MAG TPA: hypothetical protein VMW52_03265 [Phycisphaerae bacterium]|nr:hypothetical protein [Phycisphaerae bacterium]